MKKNYLRICGTGNVDSDYFIDLKDLKQGKMDLDDAFIFMVRRGQLIEKIDFVENLPGAW